MPGWLKDHWNEFRRGKPGRRFQDYYELRHDTRGNVALRVLKLVLGTVLLLIGLVMMPAPGPGTLVVAIGAVLVARESRVAARAFDAIERGLRAALQKLRR